MVIHHQPQHVHLSFKVLNLSAVLYVLENLHSNRPAVLLRLKHLPKAPFPERLEVSWIELASYLVAYAG